MKLSEFIRTNTEIILAEWVEFARTRLPAASKMTEGELRNHAAAIFRAIASNMEAMQTPEQQKAKSQGRGHEPAIDAAEATHTALRMTAGFTLDQVVSEYRALRATVIRLWEKEHPVVSDDLTRFNEAIDQVLTEAVTEFTTKMDRYREQFLAILAHDLRNPLGSIVLSTQAMYLADGLDTRHTRTLVRILKSAQRMERLVNDLLDLTRSHLGAGIALNRKFVDLPAVCRHVIEELEAVNPDCVVRFEASGDLSGEWDEDRVAQVISNLVANAIQHGQEGVPVDVKLTGFDGGMVSIAVHNQGPPISRGVMPTLFDPLVRQPQTSSPRHTTSLGLGLYIVREVVHAHGGSVDVTSSEHTGTTFTVQLPRR